MLCSANEPALTLLSCFPFQEDPHLDDLKVG